MSPTPEIPPATWVDQGCQGDLGLGLIGLSSITVGPPPEVVVLVRERTRGTEGQHRTEGQHHTLRLGDTLALGDRRWRFADVIMTGPDSGSACFQLIDPADRTSWQPPPLVGKRTWVPPRLRYRSGLTEAQVAGLERLLGRPFPPVYRRWLGQTNGADPEVALTIPGFPFFLFEYRPLLGMMGPSPSDLFMAETRYRKRLLTEGQIVVGLPTGGLLTVSVEPTTADMIAFLPETALVGAEDSASAALRDSQLIWLARNIVEFVERLAPMEIPGPPATYVLPPQDSAPPQGTAPR